MGRQVADAALASCAFAALAACRPPGVALDRAPVIVQQEVVAASPTTAAPATGGAAAVAGFVITEPPRAAQQSFPAVPSAPLPALPVGGAPSRTVQVVPRSKDPPAPCRVGEGWDGLACVALACSEGHSFVRGSGCVRCIGHCDLVEPDHERRPWSPATTAFNREAARDAVRAVDLSECRQKGVSLDGSIVVTFRPFGDVYRVELVGGSTRTLDDCLRRAFASVRIAAFGGSVQTVVR